MGEGRGIGGRRCVWSEGVVVVINGLLPSAPRNGFNRLPSSIPTPQAINNAHSRSLSGSHASTSTAAGTAAGAGLSSSISSSGAASGGLFPACDAPVHAPRCIAAFVQYLAVKRIKEPYQVTTNT